MWMMRPVQQTRQLQKMVMTSKFCSLLLSDLIIIAYTNVSITNHVDHCRTMEHGYSSETTTSAADQKCLITLSENTRKWLSELLMEGDLLEVCLDETQHLLRILNAAMPGSSDLTLLKIRYKIMVI